VTVTSLAPTLGGGVRRGKPARVDFLVDGRVEWTEFYRPYTFSGDGGTWNTLKVKNGEHVLSVRIRGQNGSEALHRTLVEVRNPDPEQEPGGTPCDLSGPVDEAAYNPAGFRRHHEDLVLAGVAPPSSPLGGGADRA